jgi:acetyl esterase/lipase
LSPETNPSFGSAEQADSRPRIARHEALAIAMRGHAPQTVSWTDFTSTGKDPRRPNGAIVLYRHGGGFTLDSLESRHDVCLGICNEAGVKIIAVEYRFGARGSASGAE